MSLVNWDFVIRFLIGEVQTTEDKLPKLAVVNFPETTYCPSMVRINEIVLSHLVRLCPLRFSGTVVQTSWEKIRTKMGSTDEPVVMKGKGLVGTLFVALTSVSLMAGAEREEASENWSQWRGPTWNGVASHADPPITWSETENLKWKTRIPGKGWATPVVWGDRMFVLSSVELEKEMPDHDHNHVDTRTELKEYDPGLAAICEEVFGDTKLVYSKPTTRLHGHLEGYDPSKSPKFVWPERLNEVKQAIREGAKARGKDRKKPYVN